MVKAMQKRNGTSFRLSLIERRLLKKLAALRGISQRAVLGMLIQREAKMELNA